MALKWRSPDEYPQRKALTIAKDWSISAITAGFLAVLISYAGPLVIFFQAAKVANMPNEMIASWVWAISMGAAVSGIFLSWRLKVPVITAWSAPGTALLVTLFPAITINQAVGAYITAAVMILLIGLTGYFDRVIKHIPKGMASGMMAGILFQFGVGAFKSSTAIPALGLGMIFSYIVLKRLVPRYCIVLVLLLGAGITALTGNIPMHRIDLHPTSPVFIMPEWTWGSTLSLAIPLVIVSLTGQYLPGVAILRVSGYETPTRPIIVATSLASIVAAFFGGVTIVIAAITAALCTGKDAHPEPDKRYVAGLANGVFYLIGGTFAGAIVLLFTVLPKAFVAILAGLALIGAISANIMGAVQEEDHREASIITFLATASGMSFMGLGSAFWGSVIGLFAYFVLSKARR